jgi:hypothetical protein
MRSVKVQLLSFLAVVLVFGTIPASATILGTVDIENHSNPYSNQGQLFGGGLTGGTYLTGIYSWTNNGGTGLGTDVPNWGFCTELIQGPYSGWQDVVTLDSAPMPSQYGTPMGMTKANYIRELWGRDFNPAWATGADTQGAEAFGACIWEIVYEDLPSSPAGWDVTGGTGFHATGIEQAATANAWLHGLNGDTTKFVNNLAATSTLAGQDYIVQVPEPATLALLGLGAAAVLRRRK